jgi:hypothetical protein
MQFRRQEQQVTEQYERDMQEIRYVELLNAFRHLQTKSDLDMQGLTSPIRSGLLVLLLGMKSLLCFPESSFSRNVLCVYVLQH